MTKVNKYNDSIDTLNETIESSDITKESDLYTYKGVTDTLANLCRHFNVSYSLVYKRIKNRNYSVIDAFETPAQKMTVYEYKGKKGSLEYLCKEFNKKYSTMKARINRGMTIEEAFNTPIEERTEYTYKGKTGSLRYLCGEFNENYSTIRARINKGMTIEEAFEYQYTSEDRKWEFDSLSLLGKCKRLNKNYIEVLNLISDGLQEDKALEKAKEPFIDSAEIRSKYVRENEKKLAITEGYKDPNERTRHWKYNKKHGEISLEEFRKHEENVKISNAHKSELKNNRLTEEEYLKYMSDTSGNISVEEWKKSLREREFLASINRENASLIDLLNKALKNNVITNREFEFIYLRVFENKKLRDFTSSHNIGKDGVAKVIKKASLKLKNSNL